MRRQREDTCGNNVIRSPHLHTSSTMSVKVPQEWSPMPRSIGPTWLDISWMKRSWLELVKVKSFTTMLVSSASSARLFRISEGKTYLLFCENNKDFSFLNFSHFGRQKQMLTVCRNLPAPDRDCHCRCRNPPRPSWSPSDAGGGRQRYSQPAVSSESRGQLPAVGMNLKDFFINQNLNQPSQNQSQP